MHASYQSPQNQPTPGSSASPTGQQYTQAGTFPQAGPSSGHYQGQSPVAASFPQQNGYTGGPNPLAPQIASLFQGFMNQPQQHGNPSGQMSYPSYPQSQPLSPQQPQAPGQYQNPNAMPQPTLPPQFMQQLNAHLLQQQQLQQAQAAQVQQELQAFDLNNPHVVDTLITVAQHSNNLAALYALQAIRACQPAMQAVPPASTPPPSMQHSHTAYSPVEDDVPMSPVQPTRKRKSEQMAMDDDDDAPVAPRKTAKKPSITPLAKDKGKQKAVPTARPSGPTSRKMPSSSDLRGEALGSSGSQPAVKQEKVKIFTKKNGTPMAIYVLDQLYNKQKRAANVSAVKVRKVDVYQMKLLNRLVAGAWRQAGGRWRHRGSGLLRFRSQLEQGLPEDVQDGR
ncbi:hypothetical protein PENSPDRAFT_13279 [Peniophora sp. CONT]|nr:hypothetical protein PENSPDRAFT_13279 [Peniophora sp. CONT]